MLIMYGVMGKLLKAVKSFYVDSTACVRIGMDVSEWFPVNVGLRQGCVMSLWSSYKEWQTIRESGLC